MEITGVEVEFACNSCACASCLQGKINPMGNNSCPKGCANCDTQSPKAKTVCAYKPYVLTI